MSFVHLIDGPAALAEHCEKLRQRNIARDAARHVLFVLAWIPVYLAFVGATGLVVCTTPREDP